MSAPRGTFSALARRDFALLWSGQALSGIGNQMLPVALAILVLARGHGVQSLGVVFAAQALALGVGTVAATAIGDRWRRSRTMAGADLVRGLAIVAIAITPAHAPLFVLVVLVLVVGVGEGVFQPAYQALVPRLVPEDAWQSANAATAFSQHGATIVGPVLAGVCAAAFGPAAPVWVDAGTFAASLVTLIVLRELAPRAAFSREADADADADAVAHADVGTAGDPGQPARRPALRRIAADMREAVQAVVERRWLIATMGSVTLVTMLALAPTLVLLPVLARERLGGSGGYGAVLSAAGVGALAGALLAARIRTRVPGLVAIGLSLLNALSMVGLATLPLPGVVATWAVGWLGVAAFNVLWITAMQRDVPDRLLGRVMAFDWLGSTCFMPLGYLLTAPAVHLLGTRAVLVGATVVTLVVMPLPLLTRGGRTFTSRPLAPLPAPVVQPEPSA